MSAPRPRPAALLALLAPIAAGACRTATTPAPPGAAGWDGAVERWGSLRGVLRDGDVEGKVALTQATAPHAVGLGAPAGLTGEVTVLDGRAWVAHASDAGVRTAPAADEQAAFLALATVPAWRAVPVERDLDLAGLEERLAELAPQVPGPEPRVFPFVVEGELADLDTHVLNGACPMAGDVPPGREPLERRRAAGRGTLVGFYSELGPGVLTHHGTRVHAHVLETGEAPYTGHVDAARVRAGATLRVPR